MDKKPLGLKPSISLFDESTELMLLFWIIGIVTVNLWRMKMPKYYQDKICGYYLYFTSFCTVECMHVHASDRKLTEEGSGKFFVKEDGSTVLQKRGILSDREIRKIQEYIKIHYKEMYMKWAEYSKNGFYEGN